MTGKRGGRRPGAGAPKGNKNALKHGRYSSDRKIRELARGRPDPTGPKAPPRPPANVIPLNRTATTGEDQSKKERIESLAQRLDRWDFGGAWAFAYKHQRVLPAVEDAVAYFENLPAEEIAGFTRPASVLYVIIHEAIAVPGDGRLIYCPECPWDSERRTRREERNLNP